MLIFPVCLLLANFRPFLQSVQFWKAIPTLVFINILYGNFPCLKPHTSDQSQRETDNKNMFCLVATESYCVTNIEVEQEKEIMIYIFHHLEMF